MQKEESYLIKKYRENDYFKVQSDKAYMKYHQLCSVAQYYDLSNISQQLFAKFQHEEQDIYFYYGYLQDVDPNQIFKLTVYFLKNFNTKPGRPFTFVFFNNKAHYDAYGQLRSIFLILTLDHFNFLQNFIVIRPSFYHRAFDYIAYDTIPKYLKSKTHYRNSAAQLCSMMKIDPQDFVDFTPRKISQQQFPQLKPRQIKLQNQRINFEGQRRNQDQIQVQNKFQDSLKSFLFVKPGKQTHILQDYELSNLGIPVVVEILVYYFQTHPHGLQLEGLFRKSVSIDDENQLLLEIQQKNYESLLQVQNPHIIANLIKRFFSNLKVPLIPFEQFRQLMHDQGKNKKNHLKEVIKKLPEIHYRSLLYLLIFLKDSVITHSQKNKMTAKNVGICFAPCLMRSEKASQADLIYASKGAIITENLITDLEEIFGDEQQQKSVFQEKENKHKKHFQQTIQIQLGIQKTKLLGQSQEYERKQSQKNEQIAFLKKKNEQSKQQQKQEAYQKPKEDEAQYEQKFWPKFEGDLIKLDTQKKQEQPKYEVTYWPKYEGQLQQIDTHDEKNKQQNNFQYDKEKYQSRFSQPIKNNSNENYQARMSKTDYPKMTQAQEQINPHVFKSQIKGVKREEPLGDVTKSKIKKQVSDSLEEEYGNIEVKEQKNMNKSNSQKSLESIHSDN